MSAPAPDHRPPLTLPYRSAFDLLGFQAEVASNSASFQTTLDRLQAEFRTASLGEPDAEYEAIESNDGRLWELTFQEQELERFDDLLDAVSHVEWHLCGQAIERRQDLLHVHGAALAGPQASVLLPGSSGIGKTTFALALALRGLRLLSDDVVFLHTDSWRPVPFPRSFHVHDDALPRLAPLGLRYAPEDHIGDYLCASVLGPWHAAPGPPLRYVLFPHLRPGEPLAVEPISGAEATLELMRYSKNLRRFPRSGLDHIPRLLAHVECYVLARNDDLIQTAELVYRWVAEGRRPA